MRYVAEVDIPREQVEVFDYLARFSSAAEWDPGVAEARDRTPDPVGLGSEFDLVAVFLGNKVPLTYRIVEFERPDRVVLRAETRAVRSLDTITFRPGSAGHTLVKYDAILDFKGAAKLLSPVLGMAFNKVGDRAAAGLAASLPPSSATE
jgi:dehydrogenase/reductase SDR family protein 12